MHRSSQYTSVEWLYIEWLPGDDGEVGWSKACSHEQGEIVVSDSLQKRNL